MTSPLNGLYASLFYFKFRSVRIAQVFRLNPIFFSPCRHTLRLADIFMGLDQIDEPLLWVVIVLLNTLHNICIFESIFYSLVFQNTYWLVAMTTVGWVIIQV